jgi:hypothetical protein
MEIKVNGRMVEKHKDRHKERQTKMHVDGWIDGPTVRQTKK